MRYTIIQHPAVENDLLEIVDLVASYAGLVVGMAKTDEITDFIDTLGDFPKIGTVRNDIYPGLRAIPASEKAVVCFAVDDSAHVVTILCISYAGSDWATQVRNRT